MSRMDEAFSEGYVSFLSGGSQPEPPKYWPDIWKWAWCLGWRLHEHLAELKRNQS